MLICDTHADTLWAMATGKTRLDLTPDMLTNPADTRVQALALFVSTGGMAQRPTIVERELAVFEDLKAKGQLRQITRVEDARPGRANVLLTIEGGEAFGDALDGVERMAALGVRMAALTWNNENAIGHPAKGGSPEGLKPFGRQVVAEMRRLHMAVDISHLNARGTAEVMDSDIPPLASHSCVYALCPHYRNLTDGQLRALFRCGGYVGVNFYPGFLSPEGTATLDTLADHMAYLCDLGGEKQIGLGSDFDGGIEPYPVGLHRACDLPALLDAMRRRGFSRELILDIAGRNFQRYMRRIE